MLTARRCGQDEKKWKELQQERSHAHIQEQHQSKQFYEKTSSSLFRGGYLLRHLSKKRLPRGHTGGGSKNYVEESTKRQTNDDIRNSHVRKNCIAVASHAAPTQQRPAKRHVQQQAKKCVAGVCCGDKKRLMKREQRG